MAFPWLALAMAARSAIKNEIQDKPENEAERKYQAETAKWTPWTDIKSKYVARPENTLNAAFAGGLTGYTMDQERDQRGEWSNYLKFLKAKEVQNANDDKNYERHTGEGWG